MKKLVSVLLVLVLVLSLGISALAVETQYDASKDDNVVTITKTLTANGPEGTTVQYPGDTLTFTASAGTVTNATAGTTAPALPAIPSVTVAEGDATATINVTLPVFTTVGVYTYTITENDTNVAGVTYHTDAITLVLTVIDQDGKKVVAAVHCEAAGQDGFDSTTYGQGTKTDVFENIYNAGSLNVSKTVAGNFGDKEKEFNFTVTFTAPSGDTVNSTITYGTNTIAPSAWSEGTASASITLKHGESVQFDNVPAGVTYKVVEAEADQDGYTTTKTGDTGTIAAKTVSEAAFTNTKETTPDTGIALDVLPYALIILAVLSAAAMMIVRKRSSAED